MGKASGFIASWFIGVVGVNEVVGRVPIDSGVARCVAGYKAALNF